MPLDYLSYELFTGLAEVLSLKASATSLCTLKHLGTPSLPPILLLLSNNRLYVKFVSTLYEFFCCKPYHLQKQRRTLHNLLHL